jgi:hypothetical protein
VKIATFAKPENAKAVFYESKNSGEGIGGGLVLF